MIATHYQKKYCTKNVFSNRNFTEIVDVSEQTQNLSKN